VAFFPQIGALSTREFRCFAGQRVKTQSEKKVKTLEKQLQIANYFSLFGNI
jgi:hypothetical protein